MSDRSIIIALSADVSGLKTGFATASRAVNDYGSRIKTFAQENREAFDQVGQAALVMGTGLLAALGASAKAAIDWESAWAGVTKTVDGTPEQMAAIEQELRGLAQILPATHEEIAAVAEAAGALGVKSEDVVGFTKTMIDLGETTNLTADEAATSLAQLMNVMGTSADDVDNLGSALVQLGNNGASTEREILEMAQRIAGAGTQVGLTEGDVLGLASALSSVGIEAEAGGSSISKIMIDIAAAVDKGGDDLEAWAEAAGMSGEAFKTAFEEDAAGALVALVQGLGNAEAQGKTTLGMLEELGITEIRTRDAMLRLAGASGILSESFATGNSAMEANTALVEEAAKRYETTEAKITIAWNNIKDAAIDAGAVLLPIIAGIAEGVSGLAQSFSDLPGPVKSVLTALVGVGGIIAVAGGGLLMLAPRVFDTIDGFKKLAAASDGASRGLRNVGKAAGAAGAIAGVGFVLANIVESAYMREIDTGMEGISKALALISNEAPGAKQALDSVFKDIEGGTIISNVEDIDSALRRTFDRTGGEKFNDWAEGIINDISGIKGSSQILEGTWARLDQGLADMVSSGNSQAAADSFAHIQERAAAAGIDVSQLATLFPQYGEAIAGASAATTVAADSVGTLTTATGQSIPVTQEAADALADMGIATDGTVSSLSKLLEVMLASGLITLSARESARAYETSLSALDAKQQEMIDAGTSLNSVLNKSKTGFDITTDAGLAAEAAFDAVAGAGIRSAQSMADADASQEQIQASLRGTYDDLIAEAGQFGITGDAAEQLARDVLGVPDGVSIDTWMSDYARQKAEDTIGAVNRLDGMTATVTTKYMENTYKRVIDLGSSQPGTMVRPGQHGFMASGGLIVGPGTGTSDTAGLYALSNREYVIQNAAVEKFGVPFFNALNRGNLQPMLASTPAASSNGPGTGPMDTSAIAAAVASAMSGWQPMVELGGRKFYGVMKESERQAQRP